MEVTRRPHECASIEEVRREIDVLDRAVIELLAKRLEYVKSAARFKTDESSVRAPDRVERVLQERAAWGAERGLDPALVVRLYKELINYFVEQELTHFKRGQ